jgi:hypothetical protein
MVNRVRCRSGGAFSRAGFAWRRTAELVIVALSPLLRRFYIDRFWVHGRGTVIRVDGVITDNPEGDARGESQSTLISSRTGIRSRCLLHRLLEQRAHLPVSARCLWA